MDKSILNSLIGVLNRAFGLPVVREAELPADDAAWAEVVKASKVQRVLPLVVSWMDTLPEEQIPEGGDIVGGYLVAERTRKDVRHRVDVLESLAKLLGEGGLEVLFLKGATLSVRYPAPDLRFFGDIDFYLFGESARGVELLAAKGVVSEDYYHHHTQATLDGVLLENHYDFVDLENHKSNLVLNNALRTMAPIARIPFTIPGKESLPNVYRMSPTMEAVFLMRHMSAHFAASETELRQLYDWVLLLRDDADKIDWQEVTRLYEASGMMHFARIVCWIVREKLCINISVPLEISDGPLAERVWADIFSGKSANRFRKGSLRYYLREAQVLLQNRWKYKLVYPGESFAGLVLRMLWLKIKLGR